MIKISIILVLMTLISSCADFVKTGLDQVGSYESIFQNKRLGIITNHTAYNRADQYIADIFADMPDVTVTALFGPEHGIRGVEGGRRTTDLVDEPEFDIPVYSLYGKNLKPTPEMLKDIDVLVFDIQDIGARFYTYISTMSLALEAAAEQGKTFVVLDRPNPINGRQVEGNILEPQFSTFVGLHPIPVRHGMTVGELAQMFNDQGWLKDGVKADLKVIPLEGWRRTLWYDQTGLKFIKTSPNMPDVETAAVYPGICLLEGTNISEGRGTDTPFLLFGAPWIDAQKLASRLNNLNPAGIRFEPTSYTPNGSKYRNQRCFGIKIILTDRDRFEPYWCGINIVNTIYQMYPQQFEWRIAHFDRLCGSASIREAIIAQSSLETLRSNWQDELNRFLKIREKYLLY
ncbi:MAG: hypothetical protein AMJ79_01865 [Phycisphaerae bacterium SM23_30]|nr:MAG: hypothetical protein AMJ79_01865 [Phycisphaerae bacterium SM23_30]